MYCVDQCITKFSQPKLQRVYGNITVVKENCCFELNLFFFAQNIVNTVGEEIERLLEIFKKRNPMFNGKYSVCGHSLGKVAQLRDKTHSWFMFSFFFCRESTSRKLERSARTTSKLCSVSLTLFNRLKCEQT